MNMMSSVDINVMGVTSPAEVRAISPFTLLAVGRLYGNMSSSAKVQRTGEKPSVAAAAGSVNTSRARSISPFTLLATGRALGRKPRCRKVRKVSWSSWPGQAQNTVTPLPSSTASSPSQARGEQPQGRDSEGSEKSGSHDCAASTRSISPFTLLAVGRALGNNNTSKRSGKNKMASKRCVATSATSADTPNVASGAASEATSGECSDHVSASDDRRLEEVHSEPTRPVKKASKPKPKFQRVKRSLAKLVKRVFGRFR